MPISPCCGGALPGGTVEWMLHADHTYGDHPLLALTGDNALRGVGVELRLHGLDPDAAASTAHKLDFTVLQAPADKPHGLREAYIVDPDGYVWVPGRAHPEVRIRPAAARSGAAGVRDR